MVVIEFEEPSYTTPENGTVEVCAHVASGQLERDTKVVLSTRPGTSTGQLLFYSKCKINLDFTLDLYTKQLFSVQKCIPQRVMTIKLPVLF